MKTQNEFRLFVTDSGATVDPDFMPPPLNQSKIATPTPQSPPRNLFEVEMDNRRRDPVKMRKITPRTSQKGTLSHSGPNISRKPPPKRKSYPQPVRTKAVPSPGTQRRLIYDKLVELNWDHLAVRDALMDHSIWQQSNFKNLQDKSQRIASLCNKVAVAYHDPTIHPPRIIHPKNGNRAGIPHRTRVKADNERRWRPPNWGRKRQLVHYGPAEGSKADFAFQAVVRHNGDHLSARDEIVSDPIFDNYGHDKYRSASVGVICVQVKQRYWDGLDDHLARVLAYFLLWGRFPPLHPPTP